MKNPLVRLLEEKGAIGAKNAIKRELLATYLRRPKESRWQAVRRVQHLAEEARKGGATGAPVCWSADSKKGGLFLAGSLEEFVTFRDRIASKHKEIGAQVRGMDGLIAEWAKREPLESQGTLFANH